MRALPQVRTAAFFFDEETSKTVALRDGDGLNSMIAGYNV
jgi:hypothetical protein